jgi:hypothetical protein
MKRSSQRGAVMVESALVVSAMLTLMLGMVELGIVGFQQLTIDAAGFLNAHQNVIGVNDTNGPNDATSQVFPNVKPSNYVGTTIQTAPSPAIPVDYGYNGTAAEQQSAQANHVGGASVVQPYILQTQLKKTLFNVFGFSIAVASTASEPEYLETNLDYGVSNLNYGQSNTSSLYRSNLYTNGEETPQFFATWANMQACNNAPAWTVAGCPNSSQYYDAGASANGLTAYGPREDALAMGEYLDVNNWSMGSTTATTGLGASGPVCATTSCTTTGPFEAAACHQRIYSALASFFIANPDLNTIETTSNPLYYNAVQHNNVQFFGQANSFQTYPPLSNNFAANVQKVYGWDLDSLNNYTGVSQGVNLLHPTAGCT